MTTTEAAAALDVTRAWLWRLIKAGAIKAERRGRDWWIEPEEVERYRRERRPAHRPAKKGTKMHDCHYIGPVSEGSPVCRAQATKAILAVSDTQGQRVQAYSCDEHAEVQRAKFESIGHKQVTIGPIRN